MEHGDALAAVETALRNMVREILEDRWQSAAGAPDLDKLRAKQEAAQKKRDGAVVSDDLLAFTEWHHLASLIEKNWESFKPVFDDLARTKVFLKILSDYRNDVAHSRELLDFEKQLLIGAAGQLRNQIALYRGKVSAATQYYPVIERVADNFGNIGTEIGARTGLRLNVGDVLTFECRANDPRDRETEWFLDLGGSVVFLEEDDWCTHAVGPNITLTVPVTEKMVGEHCPITIYMRSIGRFRRAKMGVMPFDELVQFVYAVNPPEDA